MMSLKGVVIGAGTDTAVVVPWMTYLSENWSEFIPEHETLSSAGVRSIGKIMLGQCHVKYSSPTVAGAWITGREDLTDPTLYWGISMQHTPGQRAEGPISIATAKLHMEMGDGNTPIGFVFVGEEMPDVSYTQRQALGYVAKDFGVNPHDLTVLRASTKTDRIQIATLGDLLPYMYQGAK